jgi:hypothetical protein
MKLTKNIRLRRLQWMSHVVRMKEGRVPKKAFKGYRERRRPVGRLIGRWIDAVDKDDTRILKLENGRRSAEEGCFETED